MFKDLLGFQIFSALTTSTSFTFSSSKMGESCITWDSIVFIVKLTFFLSCLFIFESEIKRERESEVGAEREGDTESEAGCQHTASSGAGTHKP